MAFIKVDKDRIRKKGAVYIATVGDHYVIGRTMSTDKTAAAIKVATEFASKGVVPAVKIVKFRKSNNTYREEALLHSLLFEYLDRGIHWWYIITEDELNEAWKAIKEK